MKLRHLALILSILTLWVVAAQAAGPVVGPFATADQNFKAGNESALPLANKAFGDPTDLKAAAMAAADYLRYMQADVTEDNAGNGDPDSPVDDPDDAGWDWSTTTFSHSATASPTNLYGVVANGVFQVYRFAPNSALFTTMKDAADHIVSVGPSVIRSGADMVFLLNFASLGEVTNPSYYTDGARAIWQYRLDNYGGTATTFAQGLRDYRGTSGWANGIIPWDLAPFVEALMRMESMFPGNNYGSDAAEIVAVIYDDSYNATPGYFEPLGHSKGYDPTYANHDYWVYPCGVSGLIRAFQTSGLHTDKIPALEQLLHECQYADGAFSYQYGAETDDQDWQNTAYAMWCLSDNLAPTAANLASLYSAGTWLASTQDASGAWIYTSGNHYPEESGECAAAVALAYEASAITLSVVPSGPDPITCGLTKTVTFHYDRSDATPGLRGYEITFGLTDPNTAVTFGLTDIADGGALAGVGSTYFYPVDNGDGTFTVSDAILGATAGLLADGDLFTVTFHTATDGPVDVDILSYKLRDPDNVFMFADLAGTSFVVDCTAPAAVTDITAAPGHNKVQVDWIHDGTDTVVYEVYRGLWYDTTIGVSAYPESDDLAGNTIPTRPSDRDAAAASAEWVLAGTVAVGTTSFTDIGAVGGTGTFDSDGADRGVYYYEVFAVDAATNGSLAAADGNDRATNYWLGDVTGVPDPPNPNTPPQGEVDVTDINALGAAFATADGDASYDNTIDVGPTDDWSGLGIPLTDSVIDFEDLMVFAMNYGVVHAAKAADGGAMITLAWIHGEDGDYTLHLVSGSGLQGVHLSAAAPVRSVRAGDLLREQRIFLTNVGSGLDANLALLGHGASLEGSGDLLVIEAGSNIKPEDLTIDLRGSDNAKLDYTLDKAGDTAVPSVYAMQPNYPNPFNPMTKISFSLPEAQTVQLAIYGLDGRRIRTLISGDLSAGNHEVIWNGTDDAGRSVASGTYFYQIKAGPYSRVRKMTLVK